MKIAVFFHGQVRGFSTSLLEILRANPQNEVDVFIHAWWDGTCTYKQTGLVNQLRDIRLPSDTLNRLVSIYRPKKMLLEYPREFEVPDYYTEFGLAQPCNIMPHMYSMEAAYKLCDNPSEYDWCIRTRFDLQYRSNFDIEHRDKNCAYVAQIHSHMPGVRFPHDCMLAASGKNAEILIGQVFTRLREYGNQGIGEPILYNSLLVNNIEYHPLNINYYIDRDSYCG